MEAFLLHWNTRSWQKAAGVSYEFLHADAKNCSNADKSRFSQRKLASAA
jgi:hypothetical protein